MKNRIKISFITKGKVLKIKNLKTNTPTTFSYFGNNENKALVGRAIITHMMINDVKNYILSK